MKSKKKISKFNSIFKLKIITSNLEKKVINKFTNKSSIVSWWKQVNAAKLTVKHNSSEYWIS